MSIDLSRFETVDRAGEHPNGPIVLIKNRDNGGEDRLHWWTDSHNKWSNRHNHRWSFRSYCLLGEMEEEMIQVNTDGGTRNRIDGTWEDLGTPAWEVLYTRTIGPSPASRYLDLNEFHRVRAVKETITLVEAQPAGRDWSIFLPQLPSDDTVVGAFKPYDNVKSAAVLATIMDKLS